MDLLKSSQNKRKLSELFSASTKPETAWKLFKAVFDLSPSGKAQLSRDDLNNGKYTKGIIKFEEYCDVYFLKGENCRNPNQAKVMKTHAKSNQRRIGVGTRPDQREVSGACE